MTDDISRKAGDLHLARIEGVRQAMATREGRALLLRLLLAESRFLMIVTSGVAADELNHFEGRRAVGAKLYSLLAEQDKRNIIVLMEDE